MPSDFSSDNRLLRVTLIFLLIVLAVIILKFAERLLLPLAIAAILAMVLNPLMDWLLRKGLPHWLSITVPVLILLAIATGLFFLLSIQVSIVSKDWSRIQERFS